MNDEEYLKFGYVASGVLTAYMKGNLVSENVEKWVVDYLIENYKEIFEKEEA